eukprot:TRINITY_DN63008_c0_g1_i1.p1 TRINITY_DN63008_c0_g1~~TRINITY_DN63008_c0_g1_i1.p1  ORF type:complete len:343 (+),score=26.80 TRINITY_DN63008_c0_g1_i1:38-1066(+)
MAATNDPFAREAHIDDDSVLATIRQSTRRCTQFLGGHIVTARRHSDPTKLAFQMDFQLEEKLTHTSGTTVQGGFIAASLHESAYQALNFQTRLAAANAQELEAKIDYQLPVRPGRVRCSVQLMRLSRRVAVISVSMSQNDRVAATSSSTWSLVAHGESDSASNLKCLEAIPASMTCRPFSSDTNHLEVLQQAQRLYDALPYSKMWQFEAIGFDVASRVALAKFCFPAEMTASPLRTEEFHEENRVQSGFVTAIADTTSFLMILILGLLGPKFHFFTSMVLQMSFSGQIKALVPVIVSARISKMTQQFVWLESHVSQDGQVIAVMNQVATALHSRPAALKAQL